MSVVFYNHRIKQVPIQVAIPRRVAKHIAVLAGQIRKEKEKP